MDKQQNKNEQTTSDENKSKSNNFFIQEVKKRAKIKQKTKIFKAMVDAEKQQKLHRIENDCNRRKEDISADILALESALNGDDTEKIKAALRNLQILTYENKN